MTTNGDEKEFDKVRMTEQEENLLHERMAYENDPEFADDDPPCSMLVEAMSIDEALYKLANDSKYRVVSNREKFMGEPIISFYLVNKENPDERHWIVYSDHK